MKEAIISLHKYWIYADKMRLLFKGSISKEGPELLQASISEYDSLITAHKILLSEVGIFRSFWYGSLFTVIEGYQKLKISIPEIEDLLNRDYIDILRLFRNGTYHFQREFFNHKILDADQTDDFVQWVHNIHNVLGNKILGFALNQFDTDTQNRIKDNLRATLGDGVMKIFNT